MGRAEAAALPAEVQQVQLGLGLCCWRLTDLFGFFFSCWLYLFFNFILILLKKVPGKRTLFFGCLQELTPF